MNIQIKKKNKRNYKKQHWFEYIKVKIKKKKSMKLIYNYNNNYNKSFNIR